MEWMDVLRNRRSIRKYTEEPVSDEAVRQILQAGLLAPSSRGIFPAEFIVVRDPQMLLQLSRSKTAGAGMLEKANVAIVVIGDHARSDAWIEDCSLAMIYMQLAASELGVGNCWVQSRLRVSQQKKGEPVANTAEDMAQVKQGGLQKMEALVAATVAKDKAQTENMSADEFLRELLQIPDNYSVEAILALGMPAQNPAPRDLPDPDSQKVHYGKF